jgi:hypothetical protein
MRSGYRSGIAIWGIAALVLAAAAYQTQSQRLHLGHPAVLSGWLLFAVMFGLVLFNLRKRLSMIPLGSASAWLALHTVGGALAIGLFLIHADTFWPTGSYERLLTLLFYLVSLSGLLGFAIQRIYPRLLSQINYEVIYERIPAEIAILRDQAEAIVLECTAKTTSDTLAQYYLASLAWYFDRPRFMLNALVGNRRTRSWLDREWGAVARYLNAAENAFLSQLLELCETKAKIDAHYAIQGLMKLWLLVHLPLAAAVMVVAVWHVLLVHVYAL